ncbi:hypothetical protein RvY_18779 [Ramazzottius varieornatus]|uniref:Uncharacterized protein n=1 Tax=Ramazzottius varieornatus TaxID=947166 RepID=A0A1D1W724_RAMVA|nr:hypothetical protein RvY_18779 [Ramazzottius varieornatus]
MSESEEESGDSQEVIDLVGADDGVARKGSKRTKSKTTQPSKRASDRTSDSLTPKNVEEGRKAGLYECLAVVDGQSDVWQSYTRVVMAGMSEIMDFVCCNFCQCIYRFKKYGTTFLKNHVDKCRLNNNRSNSQRSMKDYDTPIASKKCHKIINTAFAK